MGGVLLAQRAGFAQPLGALCVCFGFGDVCFGFGDGGFHLPDHRDGRCVVETREQLPLRHLVANVDEQFGQAQPGHFGANDRFLPRRDRAGRLDDLGPLGFVPGARR